MNVIDLLKELGIQPKRTASTSGGEYHSQCPNPQCAGTDRFCVWPRAGINGKYWCRQCARSGDAIQFCKDFMGMDYHAACAKLQVEMKTSFSFKRSPRYSVVPVEAEMPSETWQRSAGVFVNDCLQNLLADEEAIEPLQKRGFSRLVIKNFLLGWNHKDQFIAMSEWGLPVTHNEKGQTKKLWLPKGIIIPTIVSNQITKIKIRRSDWEKGDELPKYVEVSGSMKCPSIYGSKEMDTIIIVEAELDAMLIQQFASDICCCMAIGGAGKKPDRDSDQLLRKASRLVFALDFDDAGKNAYKFWKSTYANLRAWPVPKGKSPGDALIAGVDLREWILGILPQTNSAFQTTSAKLFASLSGRQINFNKKTMRIYDR